MNDRQRVILKVAASLVGAALLFPPFHISPPGGGSLGFGHSLIFLRPDSRAVVDVAQLLVLWVGIGVVTGISYVLSANWVPTPGSQDKPNFGQAMIEAFHRSKHWLLIFGAMIVVSVLMAPTPAIAGQKLIGNLGATLVLFAIILVWTAIKVRSGSKGQVQADASISWKRIAVFSVIAVAATAAIAFYFSEKYPPQLRFDDLTPVSPAQQ